MTPQKIMRLALEKIGAYQPGETIKAQDFECALDNFNLMLDSWSNENLACYANLSQSTPMVINKASYTLGTGGDVPIRPLKITQAYLLDVDQNNTPIELLEQYDWNLINNRGPEITSQILTAAFYDPQFPLGILNVYPVPQGGGNEPYTINWTSYLQISEITDPFVDMQFPPGYTTAFMYNLAETLYANFSIKPDPTVISWAAKTLGNVKRQNIRLDVAYFDPYIRARAAGSYDIRSDSYGPRGSDY